MRNYQYWFSGLWIALRLKSFSPLALWNSDFDWNSALSFLGCQCANDRPWQLMGCSYITGLWLGFSHFIMCIREQPHYNLRKIWLAIVWLVIFFFMMGSLGGLQMKFFTLLYMFLLLVGYNNQITLIIYLCLPREPLE